MMIRFQHIPLSRTVLAAPAGLAVVTLAACGSSSYGSGGSASSVSTAGPQTVATAHGQYGTYLTADGGRSVYLWSADTGSSSTCSGACASAWPPVLTQGAPKAGSGATAADLGTTARSDGTTQVTYKGHPLYYFAGDSSSGQTAGQGSNGFGATWWLVAPAGTPIMASGSGGSSSSSGGYRY